MMNGTNLCINTGNMIELIIKAILTGLLLSVFIGATFFMLIETSITRGFRAALWFDLGVLTCDALIIITVYFFTSWITKTLVHNSYFNVAGGLAFMGFGINYIVSRRHEEVINPLKNSSLKLFFNGFFINLLNPSVIVFWLGTMALTLSAFNLSGKQVFVYFSIAFGVVALFDIIKAYFASKISRFLRPSIMRFIYTFCGILMIGLGIYIILK
jgi:threonine/homoserine/homoserine lactone efflux protein